MSEGREEGRSTGPAVRLEEASGEAWIESRRGLLFFANAVLVAPELFVLLPLGLRAILDPLVLHGRPSVMLDTIPAVAEHVLPAMGWLLVLPLALALYDLRVEERRGPRVALAFFALVHVGFLVYTVGRWIGG